MSKFLVPVDGSESAIKAAGYAADLAAKLEAELTLLHVFDAPSASAMGLVGMAHIDLNVARDEVAATAFSRARDVMGDVDVIERKEFGTPASEIVSIAKADGFDLIIMGSRGLSPIKELMVGSVSERVIRSAPCPVTIVR